MSLLLECPWCPDGTLLPLGDAENDLVCGACNIQVALAPDPLITPAPAREAA